MFLCVSLIPPVPHRVKLNLSLLHCKPIFWCLLFTQQHRSVLCLLCAYLHNEPIVSALSCAQTDPSTFLFQFNPYVFWRNCLLFNGVSFKECWKKNRMKSLLFIVMLPVYSMIPVMLMIPGSDSDTVNDNRWSVLNLYWITQQILIDWYCWESWSGRKLITVQKENER